MRVIVPDTGSGYGGKHSGETAVEAARLAKTAGKPVKVVWTREEEFTWRISVPPVMNVSSGVRNDGTITAWEFHNTIPGVRVFARRTKWRTSGFSFIRSSHPCDRARIARWRRPPTISRARRIWMSWRAW